MMLVFGLTTFSGAWTEPSHPQKESLRHPFEAVEVQGMQHEGHAMSPVELGTWRMPPMGDMPMLPGLEMAIPPDDPYLPGLGIDPDMLSLIHI